MTHKAIDFAKVESLRRHMLMSIGDMAQVFGVSRMTYYNWLSGKPVGKTRQDHVKAVIRRLIGVMNEHGWPNGEVSLLPPKDRHARLLAILNAA